MRNHPSAEKMDAYRASAVFMEWLLYVQAAFARATQLSVTNTVVASSSE